MRQSYTSPTSAVPTTTNRQWEADAAMLVAVVIWAFNFTLMKIALGSFSPLALTAVRFTLAMATMVVILRLRGESLALERADIVGMFLLGLIGHPIYQLFFVNGIAQTTPGNASLLLAVMPVFLAIYGQLSGSERANRTVWVGILVSFAGMALVIAGGPNGVSLAGGATTVGDLLVLAATALWTVYTIGTARYVRRYSPLKVTAMSMVLGVPPMVLISLPDLIAQDWGSIPSGHWGAMLYSAVFAVTVGYTIWSVSLQRVGNARTAIYSNLTPVLAIVIAWLTLGVPLTPLQAAGAAIVLSGLVVTRRGRIRRA